MRSGFTITARPARVPMLIVQPTEHELHVVLIQSSVRAIHLFGFSISVAVGQTSIQAPQKSQFDSCTGPLDPKAIRAGKPFEASVMALVWRISSQARTQRVQRMHICGSNSSQGLPRSGAGCSNW